MPRNAKCAKDRRVKNACTDAETGWVKRYFIDGMLGLRYSIEVCQIGQSKSGRTGFRSGKGVRLTASNKETSRRGGGKEGPGRQKG